MPITGIERSYCKSCKKSFKKIEDNTKYCNFCSEEWSNWNEEIHDWSVKYGIITGITNDIKAGRLVSVSKVVPLNGPRAEVEFFTLSLRVVSHAKREELQSEVQG